MVGALEEALIAKYPVTCGLLAEYPGSAIAVYREIGGLFFNPSYLERLWVEFSCSADSGLVARLFVILPGSDTADDVLIPGVVRMSWERDGLRRRLARQHHGDEEPTWAIQQVLDTDPFFLRLRRYYETHHGTPDCWSWRLEELPQSGRLSGAHGSPMAWDYREFRIDGSCGQAATHFWGRWFPVKGLVLFERIMSVASVY